MKYKPLPFIESLVGVPDAGVRLGLALGDIIGRDGTQVIFAILQDIEREALTALRTTAGPEHVAGLLAQIQTVAQIRNRIHITLQEAKAQGEAPELEESEEDEELYLSAFNISPPLPATALFSDSAGDNQSEE